MHIHTRRFHARESGVERCRSPTLRGPIAQRPVNRWVGRLRADIAHPLIGPNRKLLATFLANTAKLGLTVIGELAALVNPDKYLIQKSHSEFCSPPNFHGALRHP